MFIDRHTYFELHDNSREQKIIIRDYSRGERRSFVAKFAVASTARAAAAAELANSGPRNAAAAAHGASSQREGR